MAMLHVFLSVNMFKVHSDTCIFGGRGVQNLHLRARCAQDSQERLGFGRYIGHREWCSASEQVGIEEGKEPPPFKTHGDSVTYGTHMKDKRRLDRGAFKVTRSPRYSVHCCRQKEARNRWSFKMYSTCS